MKSKIFIVAAVVLISIIFIGGCRNAGVWLVKKDEITHADALVILMGSVSDRVLQADDLYRAGVAPMIIMVETRNDFVEELQERGVPFLSNTMLAEHELELMGIPSDRISVLTGAASSTQMEAEIIRENLKNMPGIDTIILVSSSTHMRRASMIFNTAFKRSGILVEVCCSPSNYTHFNAKHWWRNRQSAKKVVLEYMKISYFLLFEKRKL